MSMRRSRIVVVGSMNIDLVVSVDRLPGRGETLPGRAFATYPGGKGANQAVAAARLGASVAMVGILGEDSFGKQCLRQLHRDGVDCEHVEVSETGTGVAAITVAGDGHNSIVVVPGANAHISPLFLERKRPVIRDAGMVLAQLEIPLETVVRLAEMCEEEGVPLMLDPAPAQNLPAGLLARCAWFTPNETEAAFYTGRGGEAPELQVAKLRAMGANKVILKRGEGGAYVDALATPFAVTAFPVPAIDTTAAGDTFNAAFATALLGGEAVEAAARFAAAASALSVGKPGAQASMPTLSEVQRLLRGQGTSD